MSYAPQDFTPGVEEVLTFTGGEVASVFNNLIDLWDVKKQMNNGLWEWDINLPVYQASTPTSCDNPNQSIIIAGYTKATVTQVKKKDN